MLVGGDGQPFYTDNENPYVDIRLYPSDNWADVVAAYVRKGTERESIMALRARTEPVVAWNDNVEGGSAWQRY